MDADALVMQTARASAAMALIMQDMQIFHEEKILSTRLHNLKAKKI